MKKLNFLSVWVASGLAASAFAFGPEKPLYGVVQSEETERSYAIFCIGRTDDNLCSTVQMGVVNFNEISGKPELAYLTGKSVEAKNLKALADSLSDSYRIAKKAELADDQRVYDSLEPTRDRLRTKASNPDERIDARGAARVGQLGVYVAMQVGDAYETVEDRITLGVKHKHYKRMACTLTEGNRNSKVHKVKGDAISHWLDNF